MKPLLRNLAILFVFLGALILVPIPKPVEASTLTCDLNANAAAETYVYQLVDCILGDNPLDVCGEQFDRGLAYARIEHDDCEFVSGESPDPWPVIDERRSWCLEGCLGCNEIENLAERFACKQDCYAFCNTTYPKL